MTVTPLATVHADDEWSPLKAVIVGRAGRACFPSAPAPMIEATMPSAYVQCFVSESPFPDGLIAKAEAELDLFTEILTAEGIKVYRPIEGIDWLSENGYTGAMPRDGLMSVGNTLIEACFAWPCRATEIQRAYGPMLEELGQCRNVKIVRRAESTFANTLLDDEPRGKWVINNSRPAFDAADFMRFGKTILGQYSQVTNKAGIEYIQEHLPTGYKIEIVDVNDPNAMHIDATILPLRQGLMVYNPNKITEEALRKHSVLKEWDLHPFPFTPRGPGPEDPPLYMTSPWLSLNALVLDEKKVIIEASDEQTIKFYESLGMECIRCPFKHVNSIGGSFHCATVDLVREATSH